MHSDNDGNADVVKQIPPNSLQHLNFEENTENQKEHKIETDHIKIPKSRVSDLQKMKQSKLANIIYFNILRKYLHFLSVIVPVWKIGTITVGAHLETKPENKCNMLLCKRYALMCHLSYIYSVIKKNHLLMGF